MSILFRFLRVHTVEAVADEYSKILGRQWPRGTEKSAETIGSAIALEKASEVVMMVSAIIGGFLILGLFFSMLSSGPTRVARSMEALNETGQPDTVA